MRVNAAVSCLLLCPISTAALAQATPSPTNAPAPEASEQSQRKQAIVLLRDTGGNQLGSGVLMAETNGGYWLATNRHVVEEQKAVCVQTVDRRVITALVLPPAKAAASAELDLALLWMPAAGANRLAVAYTGPTSTPATALPLVVATGYPAPLQLNPEDPNYTEDSGLLVPLLKQPLQGGFDLAYTSEVQKGMSGGGLFIGRQLIGINGAHSKPLWSGQWLSESGKPVPDDLNRKLELVSLGISLGTIQQVLQQYVEPRTKDLKVLAGVKCQASTGALTRF